MNIGKTNRKWLLPLLLLCLPLTAAAVEEHEGDHAGHDAEARHVEELKGPHGGELLKQGNITLELTIFEEGVPPEYHAWITRDGEALKQANLMVTLTRLNGRKDVFRFTRHERFWKGDGVVAEPHSFDVTASLEVAGMRYQWQWSSYEGRVTISDAIADKSGITTAVAGPGVIRRHRAVYGRLVTPPGQQARLQARFPGVVTAITVQVGDRVKKGQLLARVEANRSLQTYALRAPITGTVQSVSASIGEVTGDQALFELINTDTLWAELKLFSDARQVVKTGQPVTIDLAAEEIESRIASITPVGDAPYVLARVPFDNADQQAAPGELVRARILIDTATVPLAVDNRALQDFRDGQAVFIKVGNIYEVRPVQLGLSDNALTQVLDGLAPGSTYVVNESYLIKADILKAGASHGH